MPVSKTEAKRESIDKIRMNVQPYLAHLSECRSPAWKRWSSDCYPSSPENKQDNSADKQHMRPRGVKLQLRMHWWSFSGGRIKGLSLAWQVTITTANRCLHQKLSPRRSREDRRVTHRLVPSSVNRQHQFRRLHRTALEVSFLRHGMPLLPSSQLIERGCSSYRTAKPRILMRDVLCHVGLMR